ncbi:hypothetical protein [Streptomyces hilarionis]|uniref:hypothetical protein n=1 Tax=Streptomyces hilarionis TaxID=2839954 RepID=UPI002795B24F|nr:hypothetical protein [Streptomyces hilarionis]
MKWFLPRVAHRLLTGQLQELVDVMAPAVVLIVDAGGVAPAALASVHGLELVA